MQLGQRENAIVLSRRQLGRGDSDESSRALRDIDLIRNEPRIRDILLSGIVQRSHLRRGHSARDFETHREAEARADVVELVVTWTQHNLRNLDLATEINLHPLLDVLLWSNAAVIAELRAFGSRTHFRLQLGD